MRYHKVQAMRIILPLLTVGLIYSLAASVPVKGQAQTPANSGSTSTDAESHEQIDGVEDDGMTTEESGATEASTIPNESIADKLLNGTNRDNLPSKVESFYSPQASFEDPFVKLDSRAAILNYYQGLFANLEEISFDVKEEFVSGDETVALWAMTLKHKKLSSGDPITINGITHLRMEDGKIISQRNVFDAGALVYEQVPFIGMLVRWVKNRVAAP